MFLPTSDPADKQKINAQDCWVQRQMEEAMRHLPADLEVLHSPLLLEQMEREATQRQDIREGCSPLLRRSPPAPASAVKSTSSSRRRKRRRGAVSSLLASEESSPMPSAEMSVAVVLLPTDVRAAATNPASSSATALSPRLAAAPPMPSSLTPPPALPGGAQGVPRPAERHCPSSVSWASSRWDVPGTPPEEGVQEPSGIDARATSTGSSLLLSSK
ncbi:hypothetical protein CRENBAI_017805 [Crenichthys baileyi]|uniref:Uncharacterized protein n=1 Tax=Crenichthys baileyi TaxID=28760 RepID=A0AAV9SHZ0_9TELE